MTVSPAGGQINLNGLILLTPSAEGGHWDFDDECLSRDDNTFTGLKGGTTRVTYSHDSASVIYDVTIDALELPQTEQDFTVVYLLIAGIVLALGAGAIILVEAQEARLTLRIKSASRLRGAFFARSTLNAAESVFG